MHGAQDLLLLCARGSLLKVLRGPNMVLKLNPRLDAYKSNALNPVISL